VAKELELRPEPRKVLVVLSDGLPNDDADIRYCLYNGGLPDTARAVRELERRGVGVVGVFFGDRDDIDKARRIYNRLVYVENLENLPTVLGRVLKQVVAGGA
jgi:nitric oxide reductase activation protein